MYSIKIKIWILVICGCVGTMNICCIWCKVVLRSLWMHDHGTVLSLVIYFLGPKNICDRIAGINSSIHLHLWFRSLSRLLSVKSWLLIYVLTYCGPQTLPLHIGLKVRWSSAEFWGYYQWHLESTVFSLSRMLLIVREHWHRCELIRHPVLQSRNS